MILSRDTIFAQYCNLSRRPERNEKMIEEIKKVDLDITRRESFWWEDLWNSGTEEQRRNWGYMKNVRKTPGAIGCWESQIAVLKEALEQGKHGLVLEDDVKICDDFNDRLKIISEFLEGKDWDCVWLGGTVHKEVGGVWHNLDEHGKHTHRELQRCSCKKGTDIEPTDNPYIFKTYGAFSTMAYLVNMDKIQEHIDLMYRDMHFEMGIDHFYILHQPQMECYMFLPGCIKQYDSMSNIGGGWANQSNFEHSLGTYWWQNKMDYSK